MESVIVYVIKKTKAIIQKESFQFITILFVVWRGYLEVVRIIGTFILPQRSGFLGPTPWANFDGVHYLHIAESGYAQFEEAFFPFYPFLIRFLHRVFSISYVLAGIIISHVGVYLSCFLLWKLVSFAPVSYVKISKVRKWTIIFFLFFPTSYYFISIYSESMFMFFLLLAFYMLEKKNKVMYIIASSIASGVRFIGAFLLVPIGLFYYMYYLFTRSHDPFLFIHVQPAFGANRSGGELVILPQVFWRYMKIFIFVPFTNYDFWIALFEFLLFNAVLIVLWLLWKRKYPQWWVYFSIAAVILPTLTGTLSSIPRYVLIVFPMYIVLSQISKNMKIILIVISSIFLALFTILFTRGYFVA